MISWIYKFRNATGGKFPLNSCGKFRCCFCQLFEILVPRYGTKFESKVRNTAGIWNSARALDSIRFIFRSYRSLFRACMHGLHASMSGWSAPTAASMAPSDCPICQSAELLDQGELAHIFFASPHSPDLPCSNPQTASVKMLKPRRFTKISERIYISS